jgi:RNA polymerase sigma factor (sigma-70 family)
MLRSRPARSIRSREKQTTVPLRDAPDAEPVGSARADLERTDAELWQTALSGRNDGLARIFERHQQRIFRHSIALVPTPDDAKDVVAITFLEAWRRRTQVRFVDDSLLPWLLVTATHSARNISRSARRYRDLLERVPPSPEAADPAEAFDTGPAMSALAGLSEAHRNVVTLCIIEGLPMADAALVLRVPVGTVKSRLHVAKRVLADRLAPPVVQPTTSTGALRIVL